MPRRIVALAVLLAAAVVPAGAHAAATRPPGAQAVSFPTTDRIPLRGWLWKGGSTTVIFSHMYLTDQSIWFDLAATLAAKEFTALTYDYRGIGRSGGRFVIGQIDRDVVAAVRFARDRGAKRVMLVGASMGGTASLVAAGKTAVDGIVVMASGMQFKGLNVHPYLSKLTPPKLFIVGERDEPFHTSMLAMYARTPQPKELVVIPTAMHGTNMFKTKYRTQIEREVIAFLQRYAP